MPLQLCSRHAYALQKGPVCVVPWMITYFHPGVGQLCTYPLMQMAFLAAGPVCDDVRARFLPPLHLHAPGPPEELPQLLRLPHPRQRLPQLPAPEGALTEL